MVAVSLFLQPSTLEISGGLRTNRRRLTLFFCTASVWVTMMSDLDTAVSDIKKGNLVVYPTETVYGLGADALSSSAIERVYEAKGRSKSKPISLAVESTAAAQDYINPTSLERRFMETFLPGPITVVCKRKENVPDILTAGKEKVGVRVPDHDIARELAKQAGPITATSANRSGQASVTSIPELGDRIRDHVSTILDAGPTPGMGSTVVDIESQTIHRRGHNVEQIEKWLDEHLS